MKTGIELIAAERAKTEAGDNTPSAAS